MGVTLTPSVDKIVAFTDTFDVYTQSVTVDSVMARNNYRYLGMVVDPETETTVEASFQMQLVYPKGNLHFVNDSVWPIKKTYNGEEKYLADSCFLMFYFDDIYGDSSNLMRCKLYELAKPLDDNKAYYTNFDIREGGYIREDGIQKNISYTATDYRNLEFSDQNKYSLQIPLNDEYTDKDGNIYKNYGSYLFDRYEKNPDDFSSTYKFLHNVSPGFYVEYANGMGTLLNVGISRLVLCYDQYVTYPNIPDSILSDTIGATTVYLASTEEVLNTTFYDNDTLAIKELAQNNTCTYLKTPAGIFTEATLPVLEILEGHLNDTINSAEITFQRLNAEEQYDYAFPSPSNVMLIETDSVKNFFEQRKIIDNKRTFVTSLSDNAYKFSNISSLIIRLYDQYYEGMEKDAAWATKHPNWNKVTVVPVNTVTATVTNSSTSTSSTYTGVYHDLGLTSTKLVGGPTTPIKLKIVYSKFNDD